ncbi:D-tagatose-bisphosphate aldolase, class II, non-catalytic subunit [Pseudorhizobium marinum]|uniref:D-tagatose-bisphosphate aldolase, class II, non-catalytic subunit n=1 Tax=Pseudorhizobium marinum TaxID=1496690 RepID=UPI0004970B4C|nr:D-tagatose-bisphosphate aldolase, class II, non-catalytic subunit [Pseudorhizobium marinum]
MSTPLNALLTLHAFADAGDPRGLTSVCSAHPLVIEAALIEALQTGSIACIEATCNQVNQEGGYTGMTPVDFRDFVLAIARTVDFPVGRILFGGDHLGPNPWKHLPADEAMAKAEAMTYAYAAAGFGKLHLDASMACADDPTPLSVATIAKRAARLAIAAEQGASEGSHPAPGYVIGTEVPVPGGAMEELDVLEVTSPADAATTLAIHEETFREAGLEGVLDRIAGLVVQPGVEFGNANVMRFKPEEASDLSGWRQATGGIVFEAHSTDYQPTEALRALVAGGFCILKVGPGLTFALREALYGLDQIAGILVPSYTGGALMRSMEASMLAAPKNWAGYYPGSDEEKFVQRHFSYSDRIRYYWNLPEAQRAVEALFEALGERDLPETLVSQYLAGVYDDVSAARLKPTARNLVIASIRKALAPYSAACSRG